MHRRDFLRHSALASTTLLVPSFLQHFLPRQPQASRSGKILVVVQLSGGNDGLNAVIPFQNDQYYRLRPNLAIPSQEVLPLTDELGLNPAMAGLRDLFQDGLATIVNSVGYPNPDRSHFRSMDIWHTASSSAEYWNTGWLGRYLDSNCRGCASPYQAIELDDSLSLALRGEQRRGFAMSNPQQLRKIADNRFLHAMSKQHAHPSGTDAHDEEQVAYLYKTLIDTQSSANYLIEQAKVHRSTVTYPATEFGRDLKQVAELITADTDTGIYYVNLTGFDTHVNQRPRQENLLRQFSDGLKAFMADLKQNNLMDDTLVMVFSEFGRRVQQNASNGTDHGTANNLYLFGGKLANPGFYNSAPNLDKLDEGDLIYQVDFRQVYSTILEQWLDSPAPAILGSTFNPLPKLLV